MVPYDVRFVSNILLIEMPLTFRLSVFSDGRLLSNNLVLIVRVSY